MYHHLIVGIIQTNLKGRKPMQELRLMESKVINIPKQDSLYLCHSEKTKILRSGAPRWPIFPPIQIPPHSISPRRNTGPLPLYIWNIMKLQRKSSPGPIGITDYFACFCSLWNQFLVILILTPYMRQALQRLKPKHLPYSKKYTGKYTYFQTTVQTSAVSGL